MDTDLSQFTFITTKADLLSFIEKLSTVEHSVYRVDADVNKVLEHVCTHEEYTVVSKLLSAKKNNQVQDSQIIADLKEKLGKLPVITITCAFELTQETLKALSGWFLTNTGSKMIVEVIVDPTIVGGVVIMVNGQYKDYSVQKKIQNLISSSGK